MSPKNPPKRSLGKKVIGSVEGSNLLTQKSMAEGTKEWLRNITAGNQSAETLNPILSTQPFSREISVVSGIEGHRPGLHSRKSSRESRLPGRPPSAHQNAVRNSGPATAPAPAAPPTPIVKRFRFCAIIPFLLSATAFSFSLVLVLAGSKPGYMMDVNIISFNTTDLGTGIVEFAPANSSSAGRKRMMPSKSTTFEVGSTMSTSTTSELERRAFNPLDPLGLVPAVSSVIAPGASVYTSVLASAGSAITRLLPTPSISLPGLPSATDPISSGGSTPTTGLAGSLRNLLTNALDSLFSSFATGLGGIIQTVDDSLNEAVADLLSDLRSTAGIHDYYALYIMTTCYGASLSNVTGCSPFTSTANSISNITTKIPTSLEVAGTNISSPALAEFTHAISTLGPLVESLEKFFLAFMILSLINSGLVIILSFLGFLLPRNRKLLYANISLASIGNLTRSIDAILATTISATLAFTTNKFGKSVGLSAKIGGVFIALIWLGFVFQLLASVYWYCVWFVEFRQVGFRVRKRGVDEIGDYRGIIAEIKRDFRLPKTGKEQEKEFIVV